MNKILLQIFSIIFVIALVFSSLAACSSSQSITNNSSDLSSEESDDIDDNVSSDTTDDTSSDLEETDDSDLEETDDSDFEEFEEDISDDYFYDEMQSASINIYNSKPVQENFMGFGAIYHAFPYMKDKYGRNYTEKMASTEIERAINSGITTARTFYELAYAWDTKTKTWNWESERMQAMYKFCLELKKGDVEVWVNHWYNTNFLFKTTYGPDATLNKGHESIVVEGNQEKTLENFAEFMSETVKQFHAHGCSNMTAISIATEPRADWDESWANIISDEEVKEAAAKDMANAINVVNERLKKDGIRNTVKILGPNYAGTEKASVYYKYFKKYIDSDACDLKSLHMYLGNDILADNYDLWKECAENYKTEVGSFENFVFDEYNSRPPYTNSFEYYHNPFNGIQIALAQMCFLNYGMKSSCLWSLFDQQWPDNSTTNADAFKDGLHMTGMAPSLLNSSVLSAPYYSFSLVANALGDKGSKIFRGDDDTYSGVYASMAENPNGEISIFVISTNIDDTALELNFEKSLKGKSLYRHVYKAGNVVCNDKGELINPDLEITGTKNVLLDVLPPYCVAVYTTKQLCK